MILHGKIMIQISLFRQIISGNHKESRMALIYEPPV